MVSGSLETRRPRRGSLADVSVQTAPALHEDRTLNESALDAFRAAFAALFWIPYLMFSNRVKQTFVD